MASKSTINITFKLDGDSKGFQDLAKDANGLKTVMASAVVEAEKFKASIINWNQSIQAMSAVSNAVGSLNSALQSVTAESNSFSKAMRAANTMAGKDAEGFADLKGQVAELAKQIPVARDELANGLYQVISNGVPEDNWIEFLEKSARSSVGGIADLGQAVTVTSTIIKNYGLAWDDAGAIQDKIQLAAKNGVTSFEQLADALPTVAGSAAQLGVSIDELMAIFATCTGVTGNTSEVSTQLAAVLKSLIKPSSEAAKAAEKMGISFNAAAVREAGGLDNFLKNVDAAIQQYSAKTGELSETIYGQLFGSARSLRLLTSLTGEQAQKFTENVGLMVDSAGTMDAAYENMAGTVSAQTQIFQNQIATMTDVVASFIAPYQPMLNLVTQMGQLTLSTTIMIKSFTQLRRGIIPLVANMKNLVAGVSLAVTAEGRAAIASQGFGNAARAAAISTSTLTLAIRGLMIATGVGVVIAGVTLLIEKLANSSKKGQDALEDLSEETDTFGDTMKNARLEIDKEVLRLDHLIKTNADTSDAVENLNRKYGDIFGTYKTAEEWKNRLISSSRAYCEQLAYEAKMMETTKKLIDAQYEGEQLASQMAEMQASGNMYTSSMGGGKRLADDYKALAERQKENTELQKSLNKENEYFRQGAEKAQASYKQTSTSAKQVATSASDTTKGVTATNTALTQQKTRLQEIDAEMTAIKNAYPEMSKEEQKQAQVQYSNLQKESDQIKAVQAQLAMPVTFSSASDYERAIQSIQDQLKYAEGDARDLLEVFLKLTQVNYDKFLGKTSESTYTPPKIVDINNLEEGEKALEYYNEKLKTAEGEDYAAIYKTIKAIEDRNAALSRGGAIIDAQRDLDSYDNLSKRELRIMVRAEGYDSFVSKINDLRAMLNDTLNPPTDEQRQQIESLIAAYSKLGAQAALSFNTLKDGWSSVEGIGNGIKGITDTLNDDADAWTKITSIVDDFIQIYEGVNKVISIIEALTLASGAHATTKTVEGAEVQTEAGMELAAAGETVAANAITTASNAVAAASFEKLAASAIFAAHAYIPFAGVGIATGFVAEMEAVLASIGAIGAFAEGGIAYGPTLGLFGEYAGASTNPEVVAPLDKLRSMLKTDEGMGGRVRFTIEGRTLVGILERENRVMARR